MENPHPARSHAARLAQLLQVDLDDYAKGDPDFPPRSNTRPRAVLLLYERGFDVVTPLLHEFTYQAMANDLLPIEDGKLYRLHRLNPILTADTSLMVQLAAKRKPLLSMKRIIPGRA
jgi:hypothetical protein